MTHNVKKIFERRKTPKTIIPNLESAREREREKEREREGQFGKLGPAL